MLTIFCIIQLFFLSVVRTL